MPIFLVILALTFIVTGQWMVHEPLPKAMFCTVATILYAMAFVYSLLFEDEGLEWHAAAVLLSGAVACFHWMNVT